MIAILAALVVMVSGGLILPAKPVKAERIRPDFDAESGWELL